MRFDHATSSPVLVLPPQIPPHPSFRMAPDRPTFNYPFQDETRSSWSSFNTPTPTSTSAPSSAAGRKRSRDEAGINLEEEYFAVQQPTTVHPENEDEWEYGEGMTLIKPGHGYALCAASQTGTWAEEKREEKKAEDEAQILDRPSIRSAKSQRLNFTSTPPIAEEVMNNGTLVTPVSETPTNGHVEPTVDDFTRHLGIGWSSLSADEDIQAAARGWTRYINNHYPVNDVKIRLQSKGLASYLVEASEGYFLFGEDLKQGRLVSRTLEQTWVNLRGPVPVFEGEVVMEAGGTPAGNGGTTPVANGFHIEELSMNGLEGVVVNGQTVHEQTLDVEMDTGY